MDEIDYKLKSGNVILVTEAIDLLCQRIIKSSNDVLTTGNAPLFLDTFKDKCLSTDSLVSSAACFGIQKLVNAEFLTKGEAMSLIMTMLPNIE